MRVCAGQAAHEIFGVIRAMGAHGACVACESDPLHLSPGDSVRAASARERSRFGTALLGRVIDPQRDALLPVVPLPAQRRALDLPLWTGVRVIDGLLTFAKGARVGIFGPPGAGKSTLLQTIARNCDADAVVIGLVGERGREAQLWREALPPHATLVCATSDRAPGLRVAAAHVALAQAANLRDRGLDVLLVLDSLARYAAALRELAISRDEPLGRGGYPPSVFAQIARYLEVAGALRDGSISLFATVLSDGDERDPVSDAARSLLDGHFQLSEKLAARNHFPAIDVLASASRTMRDVCTAQHWDDASLVRRALFALSRTEDARSLGLACDEATSRAAAAEPALEAFLTQSGDAENPSQTLSALGALADTLR